jgi:hypothetical protein
VVGGIRFLVKAAQVNTGQQVGGSIGTALLNTIFASAVAHYLTSHLSPATPVHGHPAPSLIGMSLIHGYTTGFWVAAAVFGAGAVICGALALAAIAFELITLAWIRRWFFGTGFLRSFISITLGGVIIATIGAALGAVS